MVTDQQYWRLMKLRRTEKTLARAAAKAGMDEKMARKYLRLGKPPSQLRQERRYRTRKDYFAAVWPELEELLESEPSLEAHPAGASVPAISGQFPCLVVDLIPPNVRAVMVNGGFVFDPAKLFRDCHWKSTFDAVQNIDKTRGAAYDD